VVGLGAVVTPMLDMTFQLLFFFVLNFKPVAQEGQVDMSLLAATSDDQQFIPFDPQDDKPDEYAIHVNSIIPKGSEKPAINDAEQIVSLRFTSKLETVLIPGPDLLDALEKKLRTIPKFVEGKDRKKPPVIRLFINNKLKYSEVIVLLDLCRKVGKDLNIRDIGLAGYPR
jgi:biopolymer transport protein ExbD